MYLLRTASQIGIVTFAAFLLAGCSGEPTRPPALESGDSPLMQTAAGPVLEQAAGSGHFREEGVKRTFAFTASKRADGAVSGEFQVVIGDRTVHGDVVCMKVVGNEAWVGGRNPNGLEVAFRVVDGGEGKGAVDQVSYHYAAPRYPGFAEWGCASGSRIPVRPVDVGNIQVKSSTALFTTVYFNDFETAAGPEWTSQKRSTSPSGATFLGDFADFATHGVTLTLGGLPRHRYLRVSLDLYAIRTLDGSNTTYGLDLFTFREQTTGFAFPTTFSAFGGTQAFPGRYPDSEHRSYAGASGIRTLGYTWTNFSTGVSTPLDVIYPVQFTIEHTGPEASIAVEASALQAFTDAAGVFTDESWGIDNVKVEVIR